MEDIVAPRMASGVAHRPTFTGQPTAVVTKRTFPPSNPKETMESDDDGEQTWCPLFMDGLPKDFATNPRLAAIASLLEDDNNTAPTNNNLGEERSSVIPPAPAPRAGGGKLSRTKRGQSKAASRHQPYQCGSRSAKSRGQATLGEAQLFLSMWNIK